MKTKPNDSSAPCITYEESGHPLLGEVKTYNAGLTKREYFAAMAMQGILSTPEADEHTMDTIANDSVRYADYLIESLNAIREKNS